MTKKKLKIEVENLIFKSLTICQNQIYKRLINFFIRYNNKISKFINLNYDIIIKMINLKKEIPIKIEEKVL